MAVPSNILREVYYNFSTKPGFAGISTSNNDIVIYVKDLSYSIYYPATFKGYRVIIKAVGSPRPIWI